MTTTPSALRALHAPEPRVRPVIRAQEASDAWAIRALLRASFGQEAEGRLVESIRECNPPERLVELVAVDPATRNVIGHILLSPIAIVTAAGDVPAMALAPMGVHPSHQNRGIGSALVNHALDTCQGRGDGLVIVLGHPRFYPRFGFVPARRRGIFPPFPASDAAFLVCELADDALRGIRGVVRYPPPFALV